MSKRKNKLDEILGIDIDKIVDDSVREIEEMDQTHIQKHNERKDIIEKLKNTIETARDLPDENWSQILLKLSAEKIVLVQENIRQEIEDNPASRNVTAFGEISNALVNTVNGVLEVKREAQRIQISKEKNDLRRKELDSHKNPTIDAEGKVIGIGSNDDILKLLNSGVIDVDIKEDE